MKVELARCTEVLLWEIGQKVFKRNNVATTYALAIQSSEVTDWLKVNQAIIKRWSRSGLNYIKRRAWRIVKGEIKS